MDKLLKVNHVIGKIEYLIISLTIILMAAILIVNAIGRTVFHYSLQFGPEVCQILVISLTFIGLSNAARNGKHVAMTAIFDSLSPARKRVLTVFVAFVTCFLLLVVTWLCCTYVAKVYVNGRMTTVLNIPMYLIVSIMPIGTFLAAMQYLIQGILSIKHRDRVYVGSEKIETGMEALELDPIVAAVVVAVEPIDAPERET